MKRLPALSRAMLCAPFSPPAIVVITCVAASTRRIRPFVKSAMKRFPALSTAIATGRAFPMKVEYSRPVPLRFSFVMNIVW